MKRIMLLISMVSVFALEGVAANLHWEGVGGSGVGNFEVLTNWQEKKVPGIADLACFNNNVDKNFAITFNSDVINTKVSLMIPSPNYETVFVMNQHVWTVTNEVSAWNASGGCLTFTNGTLRTKTSNFAPGSGDPVANLMLSMKNVVYETTTVKFGAVTASFEGGCLQVSDWISMGAAGKPAARVKFDQDVQCDVTNYVWVGSDNGSTGEIVNVNGVLRLYGSGNALVVGRNGCGTMTLNGGSTYVPNVTMIGSGTTSVGDLTVTGGSNIFGNTSQNLTLTVGDSGKRSLLVAGGTNNTGGTVQVGNVAKAVGEITVTNGLLIIGRFLHVGYKGSGALNVTGGEMRFVNHDAILSIGRYAGGTGTVSISGGLVDVNGKVWLGGSAESPDSSGGSARLTLSDNGVLRTKTVMERDAVATSQLFFDGGNLQAAAAGTLIQQLDDVRLTANGMVVDTAGYNVSVVPMLQDAEDEAGGITKKGKGTLTLSGTRAATGPVSVLGGTLVVSGDVVVLAGISRIDGTLSLALDKRLIVAAGASLAGTGTVARVTLADNAVLARSKTDNAVAPLNVSDCTSNGHLTVALSGYALTDLLASLPLLKVPTATFVKPTSMNLTLNGVADPSLILKYTQSGDATILSVKYNSGTLIIVH